MIEKPSSPEGGDPWVVLRNLDQRLRRVEEQLNLESEAAETEGNRTRPEAVLEELNEPVAKERESLEFEVGQTWFALIGIVALAIGAAFILSLPFPGIPAWLPSVGGYILTVFLFILAKLSRSSFEAISKYLRGSAILLVFFSTVRLSYFGETDFLVHDGPGAMLAFSLTVILCMVLAWRRQSEALWVLSMIVAFGSALAVGAAGFMASMIGFAIVSSVYAQLKHNWRSLAPIVFSFTAVSYVIWAIGNPVVGNEMGIVNTPYPVVFLIPFAMLSFSYAVLRRPEPDIEDANVQISILIICGLGFLVYFLHHLLGYDSRLVFGQILLTALLLGTALAFWNLTKGYFSTFIYAMTGYLALSMALVKAFSFPDVFVALSVQSLVVIATAIYFCSKFIILANFLIFIGIILGYVVVSDVEQGMSLGFGIVALVSARILNWQKQRLTLETEFMRNAYLTTAFLVLPYALFYLAPEKLISVFWLGLSLFYYGLFLFFRNRKYRWMGHMTLLVTALYVIVIGTAKLETQYRIVTFLALGTIMVIVSLIFSLIRKKSNKGE